MPPHLAIANVHENPTIDSLARIIRHEETEPALGPPNDCGATLLAHSSLEAVLRAMMVQMLFRLGVHLTVGGYTICECTEGNIFFFVNGKRRRPMMMKIIFMITAVRLAGFFFFFFFSH